jgi:hypothetical protein
MQLLIASSLFSHELSGVWYIEPYLPKWITKYNTSWGEVDVTEGCNILDFETDNWLVHAVSSSYENIVVNDIIKESKDTFIISVDKDSIIVHGSKALLSYRIKILSEDKIIIDYLNPEDKGGWTVFSFPSAIQYKLSGPPKSDMSHYKATHRVTETLRLRITPELSSKIPAVLEQGTELQILEYGPDITVDGIATPWIKVLTENGDTGWCFSGSLKELEKPAIVTEELDSADEVPPEPQTIQIGFFGLSYFWLIAGGVVLLIGGATAFVVVRKKK